MKDKSDIVIIGGGIWGLSVAYHLAKAKTGRSILLLERNESVADETTLQAAGQIGQLRSDPLMVTAVNYTLNLLKSFKESTGHDPHFVQTGSLHLAHTDERMNSFHHQLGHAKKFGIESDVASSDLIAEIAPEIDQEQIVGALFVPGDAYVDAHACAMAYERAAIDLGVEIRTKVAVTDVLFEHGSVSSVMVGDDEIACDSIVSCAGPWSVRIAAMVGLTLPMYPIRLQQARTVPDPKMPSEHPVVRIPDHSAYLRPEKGGYLYGYFDRDPLAVNLLEKPASFRTRDISPEAAIMDEAKSALKATFPVLDNLVIEQYRQGMVTCTLDAHYIIGTAPGIDGLYFATGCGAMGIAGSGSVGRWLSELVIDGNTEDDISSLDPARFENMVFDNIAQSCAEIFRDYYALKSVTYSLGD